MSGIGLDALSLASKIARGRKGGGRTTTHSIALLVILHRRKERGGGHMYGGRL